MHIDLKFLGRPHVIATAVVGGNGATALVDPGPSTCLATLERELKEQGLRFEDITHLLLTHIHLDHAGATGTLVRRYPHLRVLVHERGAAHLTDPAKLVASASRLYGDQMKRLWGDIEPVPASQLQVLIGSEQISLADTRLRVAYTPGHASHHVSYFDELSGVAYVGDTGGVRIDGGYVLPPTPPPDIDLPAWKVSLDRIEGWTPDRLFITHFGPVDDVRGHLTALRRNLSAIAELVRDSFRGDRPEAERIESFREQLKIMLRREYTEEQIGTYESAAPFDMIWMGMARYLARAG